MEELLNPLGRIVVIGFASLDIKWWNPLTWHRTLRDIPRMKIMDLAEKSGGVMASHLGYLLNNPELMQAIFARLNKFVIENKIKPVIGKVFLLNRQQRHMTLLNREEVWEKFYWKFNIVGL